MPNPAIEELKAYYKTQSKNGCLELKQVKDVDQIILIRHGEPDAGKLKWMDRKAALAYILKYDTVGILPLGKNVLNSQGLNITHVFTSPTPRAVQTAQHIFKDSIELVSDERFREFERKIFWLPGRNFFLPLKAWTVVSRILWFLGINVKGIEKRQTLISVRKKTPYF